MMQAAGVGECGVEVCDVFEELVSGIKPCLMLRWRTIALLVGQSAVPDVGNRQSERTLPIRGRTKAQPGGFLIFRSSGNTANEVKNWRASGRNGLKRVADITHLGIEEGGRQHGERERMLLC